MDDILGLKVHEAADPRRRVAASVTTSTLRPREPVCLWRGGLLRAAPFMDIYDKMCFTVLCRWPPWRADGHHGYPSPGCRRSSSRPSGRMVACVSSTLPLITEEFMSVR